jgi:hypothetical protein
MRFDIMEAVDYYLERARSGDSEQAFFGLLELGEDPIPALRESYEIEPDATIRALIVQIVWQRRQPSATSFLAEALLDPDPETWKQALDGLVALGTQEERKVLVSALDGSIGSGDERWAWISEALETWDDPWGRPA